MASIQLTGIRKRYGSFQAVDHLDLRIESGEFMTLLGPSGCGKSTTLRLIAGLARPDAGTIRIGDRDVTALPTHQRQLGMVFQNLALFPHMTVAENIAFGLRMRRTEQAGIGPRVIAALERVHLGGFLDRYPSQLSGGQQQRVALARALVINPQVLLLDEPFAALDRKLRLAMQEELHGLTRAIGITTIFVTHDQEEALVLSDRITVMNSGRIEQMGTASEVFDTPLTRYVADFMGVGNLLPAVVHSVGDDGRLELQCDGLAVRCYQNAPVGAGASVAVALRPEHVGLSASKPEGGSNAAPVVVVGRIYHGSAMKYEVRLKDTERILHCRIPTRTGAPGTFEPGDEAWAHWTAESVRVLTA